MVSYKLEIVIESLNKPLNQDFTDISQMTRQRLIQYGNCKGTPNIEVQRNFQQSKFKGKLKHRNSKDACKSTSEGNYTIGINGQLQPSKFKGPSKIEIQNTMLQRRI